MDRFLMYLTASVFMLSLVASLILFVYSAIVSLKKIGEMTGTLKNIFYFVVFFLCAGCAVQSFSWLRGFIIALFT
jgi:hypothetical protein